MAENKEGQEKTEDPTAKRLSEARERGQISKSMDVTTAGILLIGGSSLFIFGGPIVNSYQGFMADVLHHSGSIQLTDQNVIHYFYDLLLFLAQLILPLLLVIMAIGLVGEISQVGWKFASKKFTEGLNFQKIFNPFSGIKKMMFSGNSMFELLKSFLKLLIMGVLAWQLLDSKKEEIIGLIERPFFDIATLMVSISFELIIKLGVIYALIAAADYFYQKWRFKQDMKMTKQEVKEESKQMEGDQQVKSRIRSLMRGRLRKLMMDNVPKADVVITNPTHFAVALMYKPGESSAPVVVAKGVDFLALKIREIAGNSSIPIIEDPPLARSLYYTVEIDQEIPEQLYKTVAQILAYVFSLKRKVDDYNIN